MAAEEKRDTMTPASICVGDVTDDGVTLTSIEWLDENGNVTHSTRTPGEHTPNPV